LVRGGEPGRIDRWLAEYTGTPTFLLIVAIGTQVIFAHVAEIPEVAPLTITRYISGATYIFTVLASTWVVYALVRGITEWYLGRFASHTATGIDTQLVPALRLTAKVVLIFVAATIILGHFDVQITALLGAAGFASLVFALAAQATVANIIAGFTILMDRPFRPGDRIEIVDGRAGDVQEIGLRSTKILSTDYTLLIVPNAELAKSSIVNYSYPTNRLNVHQKLAVPYGADVDRVKQILLDVLSSNPLVLDDPAPNAILAGLGNAALQMNFGFWIADFRTQGQVTDEINRALYARLTQAGVPLPAPTEIVSAQTGWLSPAAHAKS
jgi:small-conductance mechanosensitive channel